MNRDTLISYIKDMIRNGLNVLQDESYQRQVWFRQEIPGEVSTYIDITVHFLSGCRSIFEDPKCETRLGKETYALLKQLYEQISSHVHLTEARLDNIDDLQEDDLLNDPKWHDIQSLARDVRIKLLDFLK